MYLINSYDILNFIINKEQLVNNTCMFVFNYKIVH